MKITSPYHSRPLYSGKRLKRKAEKFSRAHKYNKGDHTPIAGASLAELEARLARIPQTKQRVPRFYYDLRRDVVVKKWYWQRDTVENSWASQYFKTRDEAEAAKTKRLLKWKRQG